MPTIIHRITIDTTTDDMLLTVLSVLKDNRISRPRIETIISGDEIPTRAPSVRAKRRDSQSRRDKRTIREQHLYELIQANPGISSRHLVKLVDDSKCQPCSITPALTGMTRDGAVRREGNSAKGFCYWAV